MLLLLWMVLVLWMVLWMLLMMVTVTDVKSYSWFVRTYSVVTAGCTTMLRGR